MRLTGFHDRNAGLAHLRRQLAEALRRGAPGWVREVALSCLAELDQALEHDETSVLETARAVVRAQTVLALFPSVPPRT